ncbi:MAG: hypothetical protein K2X62_13325 [Beijerinckiaceae bacterium]|jgi:hypothetical protein|nr:hypothetical protein [Beijerinckiaceae bacterium]MDO9442578.1 hypothetical protein [Beijerinckiaceae bacterium]
MTSANRTAFFQPSLLVRSVAALVLPIAFSALAPAHAQDAEAPSATSSCEADIGKLQQRRNAQIGDLNKLSKKGGKLDPVSACPKLRGLASLESQMVAYMVKNQNWCSIPDNVIENVKEGSGRTAKIAQQACSLAAQVKKMQSQQAAGGGAAGPFGAPAAPRLPAGPL